jgi:hypothetical protein
LELDVEALTSYMNANRPRTNRKFKQIVTSSTQLEPKAEAAKEAVVDEVVAEGAIEPLPSGEVLIQVRTIAQ